MPPKAKPAIDRLSPRLVRAESGCLEFTGPVDKYGYPKIKVRSEGRNTYQRGHRVMWSHVNGEITNSLCVLHKCDNKRCCDPAHLYLGTRKENNRDKFYRAVGKTPLRHPTQIACAKRLILTNAHDSDVSFVTGLPARTIAKIRLGQAWA